MNRKKYIMRLVFASIVAAAYAGLTYLSGFIGLAYGNIQFRVSEALCILPVFSPSAILGLTVGCFLGNIASFNPIDMLVGTFATLLSAVLTYVLRKIKFLSIPILSFIMPILINAVIIGLELSVAFVGKLAAFPLLALWVALGESVAVLGLGIPLYKILNKHKSVFEQIN